MHAIGLYTGRLEANLFDSLALGLARSLEISGLAFGGFGPTRLGSLAGRGLHPGTTQALLGRARVCPRDARDVQLQRPWDLDVCMVACCI